MAVSSFLPAPGSSGHRQPFQGTHTEPTPRGPAAASQALGSGVDRAAWETGSSLSFRSLLPSQVQLQTLKGSPEIVTSSLHSTRTC